MQPGSRRGWHAAKLQLTDILFPIGFVTLLRAGSSDPPVICDRVSSCLRPLACHLHTTGRPNADSSFGTTSVDRRGPPSMPRAELGIHGLNRWLVKCIEMSKKRGVQAAGNGLSEDRKCWQGIELGVSGLRSWGCNLSRKVRATRSSSLCSALLARITRCKFLQPLRYLCQFMYLTTVKRVLGNSFDLNYLRKMGGTWVQAARLPLEPGGTGSKVSYRSHHAQRSR